MILYETESIPKNTNVDQILELMVWKKSHCARKPSETLKDHQGADSSLSTLGSLYYKFRLGPTHLRPTGCLAAPSAHQDKVL